ncbi:MAG: TonB-dependent receptor [Flavobacteriales bacterium]|nr:TonB-dependent receptor [Flavobacteriales bacterium]HRO39143.1 TonB-dependent receptor [Flavobacteriales bacterium]HRP81173.1 TonB-dependent receptor [Flavobacteriales bacterium]
MLRSLLFVALFTAAIPRLHAQLSLHGRVLEVGTGQPVPGAEVSFPDLGSRTFTDGEGRYAMQDLPASKALVKVVMLGYATYAGVVDLAVTRTRDFTLVPSVTEMHNVVVTGSAKATELRREPVPMVLLGPDFLREHASSNLVEALGRVPGMHTVTTGPAVSKPVIRGLGGDRVLTLFDGVRMEDQQWGEEHGVEIDPFVVERVEVVKGPASLIYGSGALAGVVNLLPAPAAAPGTFRGEALGGFDSNNRALSGSLALDANNGKLHYGGRMTATLAGNFANPVDGRVLGTKYHRKDLNAHIGLNRAWGFARLRLGVHDNILEVPDGSRDSTSRRFTYPVDDAGEDWRVADDGMLGSYGIGAVHQHVQRNFAQASTGFNLGDDRITGQLGWQSSVRREFEYPEHPGVPGLYLRLNTVNYDVKYHVARYLGWAATLGANGMYQVNDASRGTDFLLPDFNKLDIGAFVLVKRTVGRVDLAGGLRYDLRHMRSRTLYTHTDPATGFDVAVSRNTAGAEPRFHAAFVDVGGLSGSIGAAWNVNGALTLKANVSRGYRAPNEAEILMRGVHSGEGLVQVGDVHLRPEFNMQGDVGLFLAGTHVSASMEVFGNAVHNYIFNTKLASGSGGDSIVVHDGQRLPVFRYAQTEARLFGAEVGLDIHPHPFDRLHFESTLAFVQALNLGGNGLEVTDSTRYLPMVPPVHVSSGLRYHTAKQLGRLSGLFFRFGVEVYGDQDRFWGANGTETRTPGYILLDAGAGGDVLARDGRTLFTFTVLGSNLANVAYQGNMSRLKYLDQYPVNGSGHSGIHNMGRNVCLRIQVPFNLRRAAPKVGAGTAR